MRYVIIHHKSSGDIDVFGIFDSIKSAERWINAQDRPEHYEVQPINIIPN